MNNLNLKKLELKLKKRIPYINQSYNKFTQNYIFIYFDLYEEFYHIPKHLLHISKYLDFIYKQQKIDSGFSINTIYNLKNITIIYLEVQEEWLGLLNLHFLEKFIFTENYITYPYIQIYSNYLEMLSKKKIDKIKDILDYLLIDTDHIFYKYLKYMQSHNYTLHNDDILKLKN